MALQDGGKPAGWKPDPRIASAFGALLDLILPPHQLDGSPVGGFARPQTTGFSADGWSKLTFISEPFCDGCGQPVLLIMGTPKPRGRFSTHLSRRSVHFSAMALSFGAAYGRRG